MRQKSFVPFYLQIKCRLNYPFLISDIKKYLSGLCHKHSSVCCDPELLFTYFQFSLEDVSPHGSSFVFHFLSLYLSHLSHLAS